MSLWQLDEFKPKQFLGFIRNVPDPLGFERQRYLPNETIGDLSFEYILGAHRRTVMAHIMGFDSEAPIAGRPGLGSKVSGELPPIKRKVRIGEKMLTKFTNPRSGSSDVDDAIRSVFVTAGDLSDSINARLEQVTFAALSEDTFVYDEGGVEFEFDFGVRDDFQFDFTTGQDDNGDTVAGVTAGVLTDTENFEPLPWLQAICDRVQQRSGRRPVEWTLSSKARGLLLANKSLREHIRGVGAPNAILTDGELNTLFSLYNLPSLHTYDTFVTNEEADGSYVDSRAMAENKSFFTNGTPLGKTLFGPTAEARVLANTPLASRAPGVWAETYGTSEPPAEWIKVAATAFPSIPGAESLAQATLW